MMNKKLKLETIKKLEEFKNNLSYNWESDYCKLINLLTDYDNEAQDDLYLNDTCRDLVEFVDGEILEYLIQQCDDDIDRLRCFIGNTYCDDIYKLDGYGNLENVTKGDFEYCVEEITEILNKSLNEKEGGKNGF